MVLVAYIAGGEEPQPYPGRDPFSSPKSIGINWGHSKYYGSVFQSYDWNQQVCPGPMIGIERVQFHDLKNQKRAIRFK